MDILIIGLGNMGNAIADALSEKHEVYAIDPYSHIKNDRIHIYKDIVEASSSIQKEIQTIILAVKPQIIYSVLEELKSYIAKNTLILSSVAGIEIETISSALGSSNIARIMPTIAAKQRQSLTGLSYGPALSSVHKEYALEIARSIGKVIEINEELMPAITGVSGSGIAFVASFVESLTMAGIREGLNHADAYKASKQTVAGALSMLEEYSPSDFIKMVCSPGGTTIEGISALQEHNFSHAIFSAVRASSQKSKTIK